ncbi:MAG TPA: hypothetical protein VKC60_16935 [Opitutaceae bacterium]|nr:hypothetical protein [Opitutaceae bacterium]
MKILRNPLLIATLALLLGTGTGSYWFWRQASAAVSAVAANRHVIEEEKTTKEAPFGFWTAEIENIVSDLKQEKTMLLKRREEMDQREARYAAERTELDKLRKDIEVMRNEISHQLIDVSNDEAKNLRTLSQTYSSLTPKAVVMLFKDMDDDTVVKLVSIMKTDVAAPIFEEMAKQGINDPKISKRAAELSEKLRMLKSTKTVSR